MTVSQMTLSNWLRNDIVHRYLATVPTWLACHTEDPTALGNPSTELIAAGYVRQKVGWGEASAGTTANLTAVTFGTIPPGSITHLGIWDAQVGGHFLAPIPLGPALLAEDVSPLFIGIGDIALTL